MRDGGILKSTNYSPVECNIINKQRAGTSEFDKGHHQCGNELNLSHIHLMNEVPYVLYLVEQQRAIGLGMNLNPKKVVEAAQVLECKLSIELGHKLLNIGDVASRYEDVVHIDKDICH